MILSAEQIEHGFWYFRPEADFPPSITYHPDEYTGGPRLNLACTRPGLSSYEQRSLVRRWCRELPGLEGVRYLWISSHTNQALLEAACRMDHLEGLSIKWGSIADLSGLPQLKRLTYLQIGSSPAVTSIAVLARLKRLRVLEIENFKRIRNLEPLCGLPHLEGLAVEGSLWTTQVVESLVPLSRLRSLRYLFLANLRSLDGSLLPLCKLKRLIHLRTSYRWRRSEFKQLRESLPELRYGSPLEEALIERFGRKN